MLVPFEKIIAIQPGQSKEIDATQNGALGPLTNPVDNRTTLYDPDWGYFLFGQSLRMEYHDNRTYTDHAEFTIEGEFTINAENAAHGGTVTDDDSTFQRVIAKYNALEAKFEAAGKAAPPDDFAKWGTSDDPRVMPLPYPLVDANGNRIYAKPQELTIEPGQWGKFIKYTAVLQEAKFPSAKVMVNQTFIDGGTITLTCPRPILARTPVAGCAGEIVQVKNYAMAEFEIQGSVNGQRAAGRGMVDIASDLQASLAANLVDIGVLRVIGNGATTVDSLWTKLSLDEGVTVDIDYAEQVVNLNIRAKAGYNLVGGKRLSQPTA